MKLMGIENDSRLFCFWEGTFRELRTCPNRKICLLKTEN